MSVDKNIYNQLLFSCFAIVIIGALGVSTWYIVALCSVVAVSSRSVDAGACAVRATQCRFPLAEAASGDYIAAWFKIYGF